MRRIVERFTSKKEDTAAKDKRRRARQAVVLRPPRNQKQASMLASLSALAAEICFAPNSPAGRLGERFQTPKRPRPVDIRIYPGLWCLSELREEAVHSVFLLWLLRAAPAPAV